FLVGDLFSFSRFPVVFAPAPDPLRDAPNDIDRVGVNLDCAGRSAKLLKRADDGREFHLVIGGFAVACAAFADLAFGGDDDDAPAAGSGIARASAVGKNEDGHD